ncbi:uncharacterized protein LAESUDRAFT_732849 [Laetiporus sulphureus 93-53]|uniref:Uncharacterized protein n=1 Tax=Laetiporus sulphureus 93-53 TaxID=1314785 RepID=A0A165AWP9_9APHY|nr:uncharacterized protein LAESUDRAFT_732849 [Laetiporus sulphureus 93-53]KZS99799.1 hypothetical protein LAESUDRAFT_732849 [Laetiporus sulphureus 93-53]
MQYLLERAKWIRRLCSPPLRHTHHAAGLKEIAQKISLISPGYSLVRQLSAEAEVYDEEIATVVELRRITPCHEQHLRRFTSTPLSSLEAPESPRSSNKFKMSASYRAKDDFDVVELDIEIANNLSFLLVTSAVNTHEIRTCYLNLAGLLNHRYAISMIPVILMPPSNIKKS